MHRVYLSAHTIVQWSMATASKACGEICGIAAEWDCTDFSQFVKISSWLLFALLLQVDSHCHSCDSLNLLLYYVREVEALCFIKSFLCLQMWQHWQLGLHMRSSMGWNCISKRYAFVEIYQLPVHLCPLGTKGGCSMTPKNFSIIFGHCGCTSVTFTLIGWWYCFD